MTLLEKFISMQSQLGEARNLDELHEYIDDQHEDLYRLLEQAINHMGRDEK